MQFPFIGPTYQAPSLNADAQRTLNLYPETIESGSGKSKMMLRGRPGLVAFGTLAEFPLRGLWAGGAPLTTGGRLFAVGGSKSYEIADDGTSTELGEVGDDADHTPAQMYPNGNQLATISAGVFYIDNGAGPVSLKFTLGRGTANIAGTAVTRASGDTFFDGLVGSAFVVGGTGYSGGTSYTVLSVTDEDHLVLSSSAGTHTGEVFNLPTDDTVTATTGAFLDGYFIIQKPDSKQWFISALNDGTKWDPLDYAIKEGYPDNIGSILADHEDLWLFGTETTEVWRNTGNADFPFERDPGAFIHMGIAATWTAVRWAGGVAWLGADTRGKAVAYRAKGYVPVRFSTHAQESAWAAYSRVSDAIAYVYEEDGHEFFVLTFPTAGATWVCDSLTGLWHERAWWNGEGGVFEKDRSRAHAFVFGKHLVGDHTTGDVYESSNAYYDDDGVAIHWLRAAPHLASDDNWLFFSRFRLSATPGLAPTLEWSDDGGATFTAPRAADPADPADYQRYEWRRLGKSRDRVFRIQGHAAVKTAIVDAYFEAAAGVK